MAPKIPTHLGPLRDCVDSITFLTLSTSQLSFFRLRRNIIMSQVSDVNSIRVFANGTILHIVRLLHLNALSNFYRYNI
jgi:hypothetical protein